MKTSFRFLSWSAFALTGALAANAAEPAKPGVAAATPIALDRQWVVFAAEANVDPAGRMAVSKKVLAAVISTDFQTEPNYAKSNQLLEKNSAAAALRIEAARKTKTWLFTVPSSKWMGDYSAEDKAFRSGVDESVTLFYPVEKAVNITYGVRLVDFGKFTLVPVPADQLETLVKQVAERKAHVVCEVEGAVAGVKMESRLNKMSPGTPTKLLELAIAKLTLKFDDGQVIGTVTAPPRAP